MQRISSVIPARPTARSSRRGVAALWLIVSMPVFVTMFCVVVDIANVWLARIELKSALDATSLAAAKTWADTANDADPADTLVARNVGLQFAAANLVAGSPLILTTNFVNGGIPNQNAECDLANDAHLIFGAVNTTNLANIEFDAGIRPNCGDGAVRQFGVRAQATAEVPSVCAAWFGIPLGPYDITAMSDAFYDCANGTPRLVQIDQYACP